MNTTVGNTGPTGAARAAAAWAPAHAFGHSRLAWWGELTPERSLEQQRRAVTLSPHDPPLAMHYAMNLLRERRLEDARTVAANLSQAEVPHEVASAYVQTLIDAGLGRFARGIERMQAALGRVARLQPGYTGETSSLILLRKLAEITGRTREVGDWFADELVLAEPSRLPASPGALDMPMTSLCMYASPDRAVACFDRIAAIHEDLGTGFEGFAGYLEGGRRYARGDVEGAAAAWRNLVADPYFGSNLPVAAFDAAGEPELGDECAQLQRVWSIYRGLSPVHARGAERAEHAGDAEGARRMAREVIDAWSVADAPVPAVARMRALLERLE